MTDPRDRLTDAIHTLLVHGRGDDLPRVDPPVPEGWPTPTPWSLEAEQRIVAAAIPQVRAAVKRLRLRTLRTPEGPAAFEFDEPSGDGRYRLLPLVHACVAPEAHQNAMELLLYRFGAPTKDWWSPEVIADQDRRLNAWASAELNLWDLARDGGLTGPLPYALRVAIARWFWSKTTRPPSIGLCLRCGERQLRRRGAWQVCRRCSRGEPTWPPHAIEPAGAGEWVLRCETCMGDFVGDANARRCPEHRLSRISPSKRSKQVWVATSGSQDSVEPRSAHAPRSPRPHSRHSRT